MAKLKKLSEFGKKRWRDYVRDATLAVNLSFNRAIGTSPFIFEKGRLPELEVDKELGQRRILVSKSISENRKKVIFRKYKDEIIKGKIENKKSHSLGDKVLIFRPTQNKMKPNWHEGYTIKKNSVSRCIHCKEER
ncbi:hypothetical protein NGRA_3310 [Nosema granulosis]|uniref:Pol polyprotein n=1 Tax=Nosema granulosis TaxID=83296 RepID=A0A9P6KXM1_9MICR|nr:hypothetical protein NGRA_3310 [Nosema granulosis]